MQTLFQFIIRKFLPWYYSVLTRLIYSGKNLTFGSNLRCEGIPRIMIDRNAQITVGNNVYLRRNVEIRAHKDSAVLIGDNIRLDRAIRILSNNSAQVSIAEGTRIGLNTVINGGDDIKIGANVLISGFVYLQSSMHNHEKGQSINSQGYSHQPISVGTDTWIGTHAVIMPGIHLPAGTVVGSNAVVTASPAKENTVLAGIPARELKERS